MSHFHEIAEIATEQFHIYQGSYQLILLHKNTFNPDDVKTEGVIQGTSEQDSFGLKYLLVRSMCRRAHPLLLTWATRHDLEEARNCKKASEPVQGNR